MVSSYLSVFLSFFLSFYYRHILNVTPEKEAGIKVRKVQYLYCRLKKRFVKTQCRLYIHVLRNALFLSEKTWHFSSSLLKLGWELFPNSYLLCDHHMNNIFIYNAGIAWHFIGLYSITLHWKSECKKHIPVNTIDRQVYQITLRKNSIIHTVE